MDFDLSWVLWGLPIAFVLGWLASRLDLRQLRIENRLAPKAYFRGLNFLLNEQQDQAIDAFIEAVQNDPDTSELHFALGTLFRRRGEYERAVRVHEHLLSRGDLSRAERHRAQHALALDFLKAGLLDRAEEALRKLEGSAYEGQALLALLSIYERTRDWGNASATAKKLDAAGHGNFSGRLAHYLCEQAASAPPEEAQQLVRQAMKTAPEAARPGIELAALQRRGGNSAAAFETLAKLAHSAPIAIPLVARPLTEAALASGERERAAEILHASYELSPSIDVLEGIVALVSDPVAARAW
jgi:lipopolysaccharide biosynthesis regulator YciM